MALIVVGLALSLAPASTTETMVEAQDVQAAAANETFLPIMSVQQGMFVDRFDVAPDWGFALLKNDPKDGYFEYSPETGTILGYITDNSGLMATWPGWRPRGDYKLEVQARHVSPNRKSFNGLGIAFNMSISDDDPSKHQFYALMLAAGGAQHAWAVVKFTDTEAKYMTNGGYRGGPNFMNAWDNFNELEIRVVDGMIYAFCNNKLLPGGTAEGPLLADNRLIGLVVSSYEFSNGLVEFDHFKITPLHPGDPEYDEVIALRAAGVDLGESEFDTLPMDLH